MKASPDPKPAATATAVAAPSGPAPKPSPRVAELQARAQEAAALLKALANPDRLLLLCHLVEGERAVGELGAVTEIAQPTLSQQLAVLRGEGLVATRRDGKSVHYRIASPAVHALLRTLYTLYCEDGQGPVH